MVSGSEFGLLGPAVMGAAKTVHAKELAKQMLTGGVPSMKKGGKVKKTGLYKLHKDETVVPAESLDSDLMDKATAALGGKPNRPKHGMRSTNITHHADGSHTTNITPYDGEQISYASKDNKELKAQLSKYLGDEPEEKDSPSEESKEE